MKTTPTIASFWNWAQLAIGHAAREYGMDISHQPYSQFKSAWLKGLAPAAFARSFVKEG